MTTRVEFRWLIWSMEHEAWWGPNGHGYVKLRDQAGRYSFDQATEIICNANYAPECLNMPNEAMIPGEPILK